MSITGYTKTGADAVLAGKAPISSAWVASTAVKAGQILTNAGTAYTVNADFTTPGTFSTTGLTAVAAGGSVTKAAVIATGLAPADIGADASGSASAAQSAAISAAATAATAKVLTETNRATTAEGVNASAITAETTRATAAEQANATAIAGKQPAGNYAPLASPPFTGTPTLNGVAVGDAATKNTGTTAGTLAAGDDQRLTAPVTPGPTYNLRPQNLKYTRRGLGRVRSGAAPMVLLGVGDSTTAGTNATAFGKNYVSQLADLLNRFVAPAAQTWVFPHGAAGPSPAVDPRVTVGSWGDNAGNYWQSSAASNAISFAPSSGSCFGPAMVDTFVVYSFNCSISALTDDGTTATWTAPGGSLLTKTTITCPRGASRTLTLTNTSTLGFVMAVNAFDSTIPQIQVGNRGMPGITSAGFVPANNQFNLNWVSQQYTPDLMVLDLGINDAGGGVSNATYSTNIQAIITAQLAVGDVLLKSMAPSSGRETTEAGYVGVLGTLSTSNTVPLLDCFNRWGALWTPNNTLGYYGAPGGGDTIHPSNFGYADIASAVCNTIRTI